MCYRLSFSSDIESSSDLLPVQAGSLTGEFDFRQTYHVEGHVYPHWPVIINEGGQLQMKSFEWGVVAGYMKGETLKDLKKDRTWMLNIRSERILGDKKSIWHRLRQKRCLVPVTGFFEYRDVGWAKNKKCPYYIHRKDRKVFFLPGLYNYSHIPDENGELPGTFAICIRSGNEIMKKIHNSGDNPERMPLMLPAELEMEWLNPALTDLDIQRIVNYELPSEALEYWPVKSLYKADPYDQHILDEEHYEALPALQ